MPEDENKIAYQVLDLIRSQNRDGSLFLSREDALYFLKRYGDLRASEGWMDGYGKAIDAAKLIIGGAHGTA